MVQAGSFASWEWPIDDRFQSAGRLRALEQQQAKGLSAQAEIERLHAHFRVVLPWLEAREEASVKRAALLLEREAPRAWTQSDREQALLELRRARRHQIVRLADYMERSLFPKNRDPRGGMRPTFVDSEGIACAVGHLMRLDGFEAEVEEIRRIQNGVYVPDIRDGALLAWVARSGLLVEEAAVIQPSYPPPAGPTDPNLTDLVSPGASVDLSGVTIDNFSINRYAGSFPDLSESKRQILDVFYPTLSYTEQLIELGYVEETPYSADQLLDIHITSARDILYYNVDPSSPGSRAGIQFPPSTTLTFWNATEAGGFLSDPTAAGPPSTLEIAFDVAAAAPGFGIDGTSFDVLGLFWHGAETYGRDLRLDIMIRTMGGELLANWILGDEANEFRSLILRDDYLSAGGSQTFAAQEKLSVSIRGTQAALTRPLLFNTFLQTYHLVAVPEPGTAILLGMGLLVLAQRRNQEGRGGRMPMPRGSMSREGD